jgi:hypothetical protein
MPFNYVFGQNPNSISAIIELPIEVTHKDEMYELSNISYEGAKGGTSTILSKTEVIKLSIAYMTYISEINTSTRLPICFYGHGKGKAITFGNTDDRLPYFVFPKDDLLGRIEKSSIH